MYRELQDGETTTYVTLVVLGVEVLPIPTRWEIDLSPHPKTGLLRERLGFFGAIFFETHVGDSFLFDVGFIVGSARKQTLASARANPS